MTMKGLCFINILVFHRNGLAITVSLYLWETAFFGNNTMSDCDVTYGLWLAT